MRGGYTWAIVILPDIQTVPPALDVVRFPADHFSLRLTFLSLELGLLSSNPGETANDRQPHGFVVEARGRRHPHAAVWRVNSKVQVFDFLTVARAWPE